MPENYNNSHESLLTILNGLDAIVYVADMTTYEVLFANRFVKEAIGDIQGKTCWESLQVGQTGPCEFCTNDKLVDSKGNPTKAYRWEFQNTVNNRWYDIHDSAVHWVDGRLVRLEIAYDVTERKAMEESLREALKEKETLLKEIHHRVKNNLAIIQSLLNLQSTHYGDAASVELLRESQNRVRSMGLIHEKLYQSSDLRNVNLAEYIKSLSTQLFKSYRSHISNVRLEMDVPEIKLDIDTLVPCGLILNELITNALKHAFPEGIGGTLYVEVKDLGDRNYRLTVKDDGVGLPEDFNLEKSKGLGGMIVSSLTDQLRGEVVYNTNGGTEFNITFREPDKQ
jgi:two-component sensor histidine kinase